MSEQHMRSCKSLGFWCLSVFPSQKGVKVFGFKAICLMPHDRGKSLKLRGGAVIHGLPPPGAGGMTSTAIMKATHQQLDTQAIKGTWGVLCLS